MSLQSPTDRTEQQGPDHSESEVLGLSPDAGTPGTLLNDTGQTRSSCKMGAVSSDLSTSQKHCEAQIPNIL